MRYRGKVDIRLKPHKPAVHGDVCTCPLTGAERTLSAPVNSLIVVVAMMMTPIAVTRIIPVGAITTVVIRSPPAAAIGIADQSYLLDVRSAVCRDWCDRHCSR